MPIAAPSYQIGTKPMQTLGGARTPASAAYPGMAGGGLSRPGPAPPSPVQPNPSQMTTYGGSSQQTDQMGRVITTTPGGADTWGGATGGGSTTIEDPDQQRRARDQVDYNAKQLDPYGNYIGPGAQPRSGSGGGGAGGDGGSGGGGLGLDEIMGVVKGLKPDPPPAREQAPGLLARVDGPQAVASPAAKSQGFARAKDNAGRVANGAMQSLRSEMVNRGIEGSGVEGQLASNVLGETARGVADASFQQERAAEDQQWQAAQLGFQGAVNQRGQDYGIQGTGFGGNVSQRGQDINAQPNLLGLAPTIFGLLNKARY